MDRAGSLERPDPLDDDEADEFLFGSIHRYDTLKMFTLQNIPVHVLQIDDTSLCVANARRNKQNSEIIKLQLPKKLMLPAEEEGRSKENDFQLLCGLYTENEVHQIEQFKSKLITSEFNATGLNIYTFKDCSLGCENEHLKLDVTPWQQSEFAMIQGSEHAVCSKCCHEPLILVDLSTGGVVKEFKHYFENISKCSNETAKRVRTTQVCESTGALNEFKSYLKSFCTSSSNSLENADNSCLNKIKCLALSNDLIAILNTYSGEVVLHDLRCEGSFIALPEITERVSSLEETWTLSGKDYKEPLHNYFGIVSSAQSFCIYDSRKTSILTQNAGDIDPVGDGEFMKLKFNQDDKFSITGMDPFVYIFRINGTEFEHVFTHTGHSPGKKVSDLVTDHIWLHTGGKEYIVSICSNSTLNCWDFKL